MKFWQNVGAISKVMVLNQIKLISVVTVLSFASFAIASERTDGVAASVSAVMAAVGDRRPDSPIPAVAAQRKPVVPRLAFGQLAAYAAEDDECNDFSDIRAAFLVTRLDREAQARAGVEALARLSDSNSDSDCSNKAVRASDESASSLDLARVGFGRLPRPSVVRAAAAPLQRLSLSGASSASGSCFLEDDEVKAIV